ncbi:MAG: DUF3050 domain-containing protein [Bacteroidia bacterium]|nr:DUF3050 domain-containing protein [Bacteroidia bacterium]MDW8159313.1 DUF3050 domain-containing protein [Bacteroidia bacterium]
MPSRNKNIGNFISPLAILKKEIHPLRNQLIEHPVFFKIQSLKHLQKFMEYHVYAVWDFMSLLKALQAELTCISIPWIPVGNPNIRYLINEIVVGEESDLHLNKEKRISHFELYLEAMQEIGCNTTPILNFIHALQKKATFEQAAMWANIPHAPMAFMQTTFACIQTKQPHLIAAVFTLGREDLIPDMFLQIVHQLEKEFPDKLKTFKYYLNRHIQLDSEHHSHLASQMLEELCKGIPKAWQEVQKAVIEALNARKHLWDAVLEEILDKN